MVTRRPVRFADALTPFDAEEIARLERFARKAEELRTSRFYTGTQSLDLTTGELTADQEAIRAMIPPLRVLYQRQNNASFSKTRTRIATHARQR